MLAGAAMPIDDRTARAVRAVLGALDYEVLAEVYCEEGGLEFWRDRREAVEELGLLWAEELSRRLRASGRSLYVGAGVAELPALLVETLSLGRECLAVNLRARECAALRAGLESAGLHVPRLRIEAADAADFLAPGRYDHVSAVSVLSDPETYPWLSAVTYGRADPLRLDAAAFAAEREDVRRLAGGLLDSLAPPAWLTTSVEEVAWFCEQAARRGLRLEPEPTTLETAVVGDPIGILRLTRP